MKNPAAGIIFVGMILAGAAAVAADDLSQSSIGLTVVDLSDAKRVFEQHSMIAPEKGALPSRDGVLIAAVHPYSPAAKAQMQVMDVVTVINGKRIKSAKEFREIVSQLEAGKKAKLSGYSVNRENGPRLTWLHRQLTLEPVSTGKMYRSAMYRETDKFEDLVVYRHRNEPRVDNISAINVYVVQKGDSAPGLRMRVQFVGESWLFIQKLQVSVDGNTFELIPEQVGRENNDMQAWEWFDHDVSDNERKLLESIAKGKRISVRYAGKQYKSDRTMKADERGRIATVLGAYRAMGGK